MHGMTALTAALTLMDSGCDWRFDRPPPIVGDGGDIDAMTGGPDASSDHDASPPCVADTIICDDDLGRYVDCSTTGTVEFEMQCPLGCAGDVEKCLDVDPSNGLAMYLDMAAAGPDVAFSGQSSIETEADTVFDGPDSITLPSVVLNDMRVYMVNSLTISDTLKVTGEYTLVFVVNGDVTIDGVLDVSADMNVAGAGGYLGYDEDETDPCQGQGTFSGNPTAGAGGGAHFYNGGQGGDSAGGPAGAAGGTAFSNDDLQPLRGGCNGGQVNESGAGTGGLSVGGGGGGGVQIVSRTQIEISGAGKIDASGGGGASGVGTVVAGGGGGGSGGVILLEAPQIVLAGAEVVLSTKGGGGASVGNGATAHHGQNGGTAPGVAFGGINSAAPDGGNGGDGTTPPTDGQDGGSGIDGGGGGGACGHTRINSTAGTINPQGGAVIRSRTSTGALGTRLVP